MTARPAPRHNPRPISRNNRKSARRRAAVEKLELRTLFDAAIVVNTALDETIANSTTSLREAIAITVNNPGDDAINFDPTIFPSGSQTTIRS